MPDPVDTLGDTLGVRPFPLPGLLAQVNAVLATIPPDEPVAVVAVADEQTLGLYAFVRIKKSLSFMGQIRRPWHGALSYGAQVVWTPLKGKW